jgi:hypothetical protein
MILKMGFSLFQVSGCLMMGKRGIHPTPPPKSTTLIRVFWNTFQCKKSHHLLPAKIELILQHLWSDMNACLVWLRSDISNGSRSSTRANGSLKWSIHQLMAFTSSYAKRWQSWWFLPSF